MKLDYQALLSRYGCPLYLYDEESISGQIKLLKEALPGFQPLYSVKTNPHPAICRLMAENGFGADAASGYEVERARAAGLDRDMIVYSAPGKTAEQLNSVLGDCLVVADSYSELQLLNELAEARGIHLPVGLRINPSLSFGPGFYPELRDGVSAKIGVDEESLEENQAFFKSLKNISLVGIHVFLRSQILSPSAIAASFEKIFKIAEYCRRVLAWDLSFINFGGGLGISPDPAAPGLNLNDLSGFVNSLLKKYDFKQTRLFIESGRFLVAEAGCFVTRIVDVKISRGQTFVIAPGGLSGFLRPALMNLLKKTGYEGGPLEPLFSGPHSHLISLPDKTGRKVKVTVAGNLCTALDVMAENVDLPEPAVGDILTVSNAGAYAASLSPFTFASFPRPPELFLGRDGCLELA